MTIITKLNLMNSFIKYKDDNGYEIYVLLLDAIPLSMNPRIKTKSKGH